VARVLCVDDETSAVQLKCAILQGAGHIAVAALTAEQAIAQLQSENFDAVVTDWRLGEERGRAIVVSGYVSEAFRAAEPTADLYLEKPVDPDELLKIVNALLDGKSSEQML